MSLNHQVFAVPSDPPGRIKQLYLRPASAAGQPRQYEPCFYFEARIDYADVRSGFHLTCGLHDILDIRPYDSDETWTRDMVRTVDPTLIQVAKPDEAICRPLPEYVNEEFLGRVETQYLSYLLRYAEARIFRNFALNIYSQPGESRCDFQSRCLEGFQESFRGELDAMREVVNRRLERIEEKHISGNPTGEFESDRRLAQARSRLQAIADRITELFLQIELSMEPADIARLQYPDPARPDLEQSLESLETDVRRDTNRLMNSYLDKVRNIDEYILHPGLKDLHLVRKCILWMPCEVCQA
jgi:hypothetical protein